MPEQGTGWSRFAVERQPSGRVHVRFSTHALAVLAMSILRETDREGHVFYAPPVLSKGIMTGWEGLDLTQPEATHLQSALKELHAVKVDL